MKNLMAFVSSTKNFYRDFRDFGTLTRMQIDNSLDLGWKREDITLATNFDFEYNGIKSIVVSDSNFVPYSPETSKFKAILELFDRNILNKKDLYWFHDLDALQSEIITESELDIGEADMALADYGWREKWNTGSVFFTSNAKDIIEGIVMTQDLFKFTNDEKALMLLTGKFTIEENHKLNQLYSDDVIKNTPVIKNIGSRIKKINISYNFVPVVNTQYCYQIALKPIKVVHFRPKGAFPDLSIPSLLNFYMYGKNDINTVLMSERLIKMYQNHGFK